MAHMKTAAHIKARATFILIEQPRKRARDQGILRASGLPMVELTSMRELKGLYEAWNLRR